MDIGYTVPEALDCNILFDVHYHIFTACVAVYLFQNIRIYLLKEGQQCVRADGNVRLAYLSMSSFLSLACAPIAANLLLQGLSLEETGSPRGKASEVRKIIRKLSD